MAEPSRAASSPLLAFSDTLLERCNERAELLRCYQRSREGQPTLVLLRGDSGVGKTRLVQSTLEERVQEEGGEFLVGNFDLLQQPEPYQGFLQAFAHYAEASGLFASDSAGADSKTAKTAPKEESVESDDNTCGKNSTACTTSTTTTTTGNTSTQRFAFLLFLRSITQPVVLLLTNLQHANACAMKILEGVITDLGQFPNVLVVVTTTEEDTAGCLLSADAVLHLQLLTQEEIDSFIGRVWNVDSSLQRSRLAADLYRHTAGNMFHMCEMMFYFVDRNIVVIGDAALAVNQTKVDALTDATSSISITDYRLRTSQLTRSTSELLKVASCFGLSVPFQILERIIPSTADHVDEAVQNQFVRCASNRLYFIHECTQRAVYELLPSEEVLNMHLSIGRSLWASFTTSDTLHSNLFVVLRHFVIAKKLVKEKKERYALAHLCLAAGRKAWTLSTFHTASIYLNLGIEVLGDSGWEEQYELTLGCHNTVAEMYLCLPDFEAAEQMIDTVSRMARNEDDQIQTEITRLYLLFTSNRQNESIDLATRLLDRLGERIPKRSLLFVTWAEHRFVSNFLNKKTDTELLSLQPMTDKKKLQCMQILNLLFFHATIVRPNIAPLVALKFMSLTLKHGVSLMAPQAFACYGMIVSSLRRYDEARRFGSLGIKLLETLGHDESVPRVYAAWYGSIYPLHRPSHEAAEKLLEGYRVGLQTGDFEFAALNANFYLYFSLDGWVSLNKAYEEYMLIESSMKALKQETMVRFITPLVECLQQLRGEECGRSLDFEKAFSFCMNNDLRCMATGITIHRLVLSSIFGNFEAALPFANHCVRELRQLISVEDYALVMMCVSITMFENYRGGSFFARQRAIQTSKRALKFLQEPCLNCPNNFLPKALLIEAELNAFLGREKLAMQKYFVAIKSSSSFMTAALSSERAARYLLRVGRVDESSRHFTEALQFYDQWGAAAKVSKLKEEITIFFPDS